MYYSTKWDMELINESYDDYDQEAADEINAYKAHMKAKLDVAWNRYNEAMKSDCNEEAEIAAMDYIELKESLRLWGYKYNPETGIMEIIDDDEEENF